MHSTVIVDVRVVLEIQQIQAVLDRPEDPVYPWNRLIQMVQQVLHLQADHAHLLGQEDLAVLYLPIIIIMCI